MPESDYKRGLKVLGLYGGECDDWRTCAEPWLFVGQLHASHPQHAVDLREYLGFAWALFEQWRRLENRPSSPSIIHREWGTLLDNIHFKPERDLRSILYAAVEILGRESL